MDVAGQFKLLPIKNIYISLEWHPRFLWRPRHIHTIKKAKVILWEKKAYRIVDGFHTKSVYVGHSFWKVGKSLFVDKIVNILTFPQN